jgi:hypothetical protein
MSIEEATSGESMETSIEEKLLNQSALLRESTFREIAKPQGSGPLIQMLSFVQSYHESKFT